MVNLYSLERLAEGRQMDVTAPFRKSAAPLRTTEPRAPGAEPARPSVRSRLGFLMVRFGLRLSDEVFPPQTAGAQQCVCVPMSN